MQPVSLLLVQINKFLAGHIFSGFIGCQRDCAFTSDKAATAPIKINALREMKYSFCNPFNIEIIYEQEDSCF